MHKLVRRMAAAAGKVRRRWLRYDRRFGWPWRILNLVVAGVVIVEIAAPLVVRVVELGRYRIDDDTRTLVGKVNTKLTNNLTFDAKTKAYRFNPEPDSDDRPNQIQSHVGASSKASDNLYSVDLPEDLSKGITYHDSSTNLAFTMVPQFGSLKGKLKDGYLVYPLDRGQAIYTLKSNGVKEDIILREAVKGELRYSYELKLPKTLEARMIGDTGALGIYSANPALFGDINYSTDQDKADVEKAREKSTKDFLVFGMPAPIIKGLDGNSVPGSNTHFEFKDNTLTVVANGLGDIKAPVTLDPSIVVTSSSDFATASNNEGNIDFPTDQIERGAFSGAGVSAGWTSATNALGTARYQHSAVAYNGKLYVLGGNDGSARNDVVYASFSSGDVGSWTSTTSFTTARYGHTSVVYNGNLYVIGGYNGTTYYNDIQYAPIASDGTVGSWTTAATTFSTARYLHASVVYKDYLYVIGGTNGTNQNDVQYAAIKASGDLGAWGSAGSGFTNIRSQLAAVAYNGYLYVIGGVGASNYNDIQYTAISSTGTIGTWYTNSTSFATARYGHTSVVYNGYLYVIGGYNGSTYYNTVQYAPIYENGSVGGWTTDSSTFTTARNGHASVAYKGYLYAIGGTNGSAQSSIYYAAIDSEGKVGTYATNANALAATRHGAAIAAGRGYIYVIGGDNGGSPVSTTYVAAIGNDGTLGSWSSTGSSLTARTHASALQYKDWLYVLGGCNTTFSSCGTGAITACQRAVITAGTLGAWSTVTCFSTARHSFGLGFHVDLNSSTPTPTIFAAGGISTTGTYLTDVSTTTISTSGTLAAWNGSGTNTDLPAGRANFGMTTYDNFLYIAGGYDGSSYKNDVIYSEITSLGTNGSWTTGSSFTNTRRGLSLFADRGYLYLNGGYNGSTYYSDTQFAAINTDGSLDSWASTSSFTTGRMDHSAIAYGGYAYVIGGYDGSSYYSDVQYAPINNGGGGMVTSWGAASNTFSNARYNLTSVAYNGFIYVLGGYDDTTYYNTVQYAPINTDGDLGSWSGTNSFTNGRLGHTTVVYNGYMYVIGGRNASTRYSDVQYALINSNGTVGSWASDPDAFTTGRSLHASVAYNGYLYIIGGETPSNPNPTNYNDVQYALICTGSNNGVGGCGSTAGQVGTWGTTTVIPEARSKHSVVVYNGYMYTLGGINSGSYRGEVYYALICTGNNNGVGGCGATAGTVGTWTLTTTYGGTRVLFHAIAKNGFMYIFGGDYADTYLSDVQYAPIKANGELGSWSYGADFGTARNSYGIAQYNGNVYIVGGYNGSPSSSIQYGTLKATSRKSTYSKLITIGTTVAATGVTYNGTLPIDSLSSITYKTTDSSGTFNDSGTCMGSGATIGGYVYITITLDDSTTSTYPDMDATQANITDFTLSYNAVHPAPSIRLHLGKTLQGGSTLTPLDTCGL